MKFSCECGQTSSHEELVLLEGAQVYTCPWCSRGIVATEMLPRILEYQMPDDLVTFGEVFYVDQEGIYVYRDGVQIRVRRITGGTPHDAR